MPFSMRIWLFVAMAKRVKNPAGDKANVAAINGLSQVGRLATGGRGGGLDFPGHRR